MFRCEPATRASQSIACEIKVFGHGAFSTAGFSGETEEEHAATLDLMRAMRYEQAFMFAYRYVSGLVEQF